MTSLTNTVVLATALKKDNKVRKFSLIPALPELPKMAEPDPVLQQLAEIKNLLNPPEEKPDPLEMKYDEILQKLDKILNLLPANPGGDGGNN